MGEQPGRVRNTLDAGNLALQSGKLFVMPLALLALLPLSWSVAFFRTRTVLAGRGNPAGSAKIAGAWPRQSWGLLLALLLFSTVVLMNVLILVAAAPSLARIVSGTENDFTRLGFTINGVVLESAFGLAWLILDPLYQAAYAVRALSCRIAHDGARSEIRDPQPHSRDRAGGYGHRVCACATAGCEHAPRLGGSARPQHRSCSRTA